MERIVKGIWIPIEIWQDTDLSWNEKILLMEIDSFTSRGRECYISNEYIANLLGVSTRWASQYLSHLVDRNLVKVVRFDGRARYVESNLNLLQAEWKKTSRQGGRKLPHTYNKETDINVVDKSTTIYTAKGTNSFQKPTLQEVADYCRERGNSVDPEAFIAHYESNGWMVGRNKMKNWRQAVITWEKSTRRTTPSQTLPQKESVLEHNLKVADRLMGTNLHAQYYGKKEGGIDEQ
jgi:hypothetical protein